jgi:membrane-bound lytic murein transglycosylase D
MLAKPVRTLHAALATCLAATLMLAPRPAAARDREEELEARIARLEAALAERPRDPGAYTLPEDLTFCGEKINLSDPWVRERLEKELLMVLGDRAQVALWTKRARAVFPVIEAEAKAVGTCADLKYLAVIESGLRAAVSSRASARGWWQFMSGTAKDYGLETDTGWDTRADLKASTRAGLRYLSDLERRFGSWSLAMAAYNTGPGRLQRAQETQGQTDFWHLDLYTEAERYVPRVIAVKAVMSDLAGYDFNLQVEDGWAPYDVGLVKVRLPKECPITLLAAARGTNVPMTRLRALNPEIGGDTLPVEREILVKVPRGHETRLRDWLHGEVDRQRSERAASGARGGRPGRNARAGKKAVKGRAASASGREGRGVSRRTVRGRKR